MGLLYPFSGCRLRGQTPRKLKEYPGDRNGLGGMSPRAARTSTCVMGAANRRFAREKQGVGGRGPWRDRRRRDQRRHGCAARRPFGPRGGEVVRSAPVLPGCLCVQGARVGKTVALREVRYPEASARQPSLGLSRNASDGREPGKASPDRMSNPLIPDPARTPSRRRKVAGRAPSPCDEASRECARAKRGWIDCDPSPFFHASSPLAGGGPAKPVKRQHRRGTTGRRPQP